MRKQTLPFLWGTATSSHQIEGGNRNNDWWAWEQEGRLLEASGAACDHYHRFREDFGLISHLGHNAYRFSLEWSRFEPEEGKWDPAAFDFYREIFEELKKRNIEPVVTLHHFTNPQWFAEKGGWLNRHGISSFVRYVKRVVQAYGSYVRLWITLNEPLIYLYHSYYAGLWPPGLKSYPDSMKVFHHMLEAHLEAYRVIHRHYEHDLRKQVWVSIAQHISWFTPCHPLSWRDRLAVFFRNWFVNDLFLDGAVNGYLFFPGIFSEFLSLRKSLDFIGLNYYTRDFIHFPGWSAHEAWLGEVCDKAHHGDQVEENTLMGWEVYPDGLYQILKRLKRYHLPIVITENGIATLEDSQRERFIRNHLQRVQRAVHEGVPVRGYFYWSLLDNFEWAHGFGPRFGIIGVDYPTQTRKIRNSAYVLSECCRKIDSRS